MADDTSSNALPSDGQNAANPLQSELELAQAELKRVQLESEQAKFVNQRQRNENDGYRRQIEDYRRSLQESGYTPPEPSQESRLEERLDRQNEEMGLMRYKLENPDWQETWAEVQGYIQDPVKVEEVAVWDRQGKPDMYKSLTNAQTRVEVAKLRALKEETAAAKKSMTSEQNRMKGQATISGVSASAGEEIVDLSDPRNPDGSPMDSNQMIDAGLVDMDPRDPVHKRGPS